MDSFYQLSVFLLHQVFFRSVNRPEKIISQNLWPDFFGIAARKTGTLPEFEINGNYLCYHQWYSQSKEHITIYYFIIFRQAVNNRKIKWKKLSIRPGR